MLYRRATPNPMRTRLWLFGLLLVVPLLGFAVSSAIRGSLNSELRDQALRQHPNADAASLATITVARLCESHDTRLDGLCETDGHLASLRTASAATALVGLGLIAGIALAGFAAQRNRAALLSLFRPGLYVTAVATTGLIVAHAAIAIAVIYYGESFVADRVHGGIILGVAIGAILGVVGVARSAFGVVRKAESFAIGASVTREAAPRLWEHTASIAGKLGALEPDHVVVGLDPTFFVTEANVSTLDARLKGRTLFCSLPLARILTVDEFTSIVGHELGHFRGEDTKFSEHFYPIYRGTVTAIASLQRAGGRGAGVLALLPAIAIFGFFLERFSVAEKAHSRERELLADRAGAEATSARIMASALVKVHAFAGVWDGFQRASVEALRGGKRYRNASVTYAQAVGQQARASVLDGIADRHTSHPTDSHPPLSVRLAALGVDVSAVAAEALSVTPTPSAASLFGDLESREEALSESYQLLLARQLGIQPTPKVAAGA